MGELIFATILAALYFSVLFLPTGFILQRRCAPELPGSAVLPLSLALGALSFAAALAVFRVCGLTPATSALLFRIHACAALVIAVRAGMLRELLPNESRLGVAIWHTAYLIAVMIAAFPGENIPSIQPDTIQRMSRLAIDNVIPYNAARYFIEAIPFDAIEVVPGWSFTERGPLSGMLTAVMMLVLGVSDGGHWLSGKPGVFFLFEAFLAWLNAFSLYVAWLLATNLFGRRSAAAGLVLISSSYFFWVNAYFSWPKLFAASLFLSGLWVFFRRRPVLGGVLLAESFLAHESVIFALLGFGFYGLCQLRVRARELFQALAAFLVLYSPWLLFRSSSGSASARLAANHLFCFHDPDLVKLGFSQALAEYLQRTSFAEIALVRLENLAYPFNFFHAWGAWTEHWNAPLTLAASVTHLTFYQFMYAVGIPGCVLGFIGFAKLRELRPYAAVGFGSLVFAGLLIACPLMTVNHAWAYPLFLLFALAAGGATEHGGTFARLLFVAALLNNLLFLYLSFIR